MSDFPSVGIVGLGVYLPKTRMTAKEIADATGGTWSEEAVINKLGIVEKAIPSGEACDFTQEMGAAAAIDCLNKTGVDPLDIDVIVCITEEWKEYPLTTSACYVQDRIGAKNAWGIDVQNRCCSCVSAMEIAKDILIADDSIDTAMVVGGYRNCDLLDYTDPSISFMYNLACGGGAIILKKNYGKNLLLATKCMSDGSVVHTCGVEVGGLVEPCTKDNIDQNFKIRTMDSDKMKGLLNTTSMPNWYHCIDTALSKAGYTRKDINYLDILHIKPSGHRAMLKDLGLTEDQTIYLDRYGHVGQIDQILSLKLALEQGKVKDGSVVVMIAAGIGYTWSANVIKWG